jgi:hypothetical protein
MLEGTDENPRRRWISKDFPLLVGAGVWLLWLNTLILLHNEGLEQMYRDEKVDLSLVTFLFIYLRNPLWVILVSAVYFLVLFFFWRNGFRKSIWVLALWLLFNTGVMAIEAYGPLVYPLEPLAEKRSFSVSCFTRMAV